MLRGNRDISLLVSAACLISKAVIGSDMEPKRTDSWSVQGLIRASQPPHFQRITHDSLFVRQRDMKAVSIKSGNNAFSRVNCEIPAPSLG